MAGVDVLSGVADLLDLLQCPSCAGSLACSADGAIACTACRAPVRMREGIVDFVASAASTQLDQIDYDQFYAIDENHALMTYDDIRATAGPRWPAGIGDALEIGCGTGGFSMAMLARMPASRLLLTDVSVKMLAICRDRLARMPGLLPQAIGYATYSTRENAFRPGTFDTCYGTAVVHHVLDVPFFLVQVHRLLKPHGVAFFMEPNLRFHQALTATLADILAGWLRIPTVPPRDMTLMMNWISEVHCNIVNTGDLEVLADREDKHLFTAEGFVAMAEEAGFASAEALPCHPDPTGLRTIGAILHQVGITPETRALLRSAWLQCQGTHFAALAQRDSAPSYVFWLHKGGPRCQTVPDQCRPVFAASSDAPIRLWLTLGLERRGQELDLHVEGWCLSSQPVGAVQISLADQVVCTPIWRPRPDVETLVNTQGDYPPLHALCSGIEATISLGHRAGTGPVEALVDIVAADGTLLPRGSVTLVPDGEKVLLQ